MWFAENKSWSEYRRSLGGFSAIVCKDGSTVWAEDASGKTIASGEAGVDDASVIQSAVNIIADAGGGQILLKSGLYILTDSIKLTTPIIFSGEGLGTILKMADGVGEIPVISIESNNVVIRDLLIDGNRVNRPEPTSVPSPASGILAHWKNPAVEDVRIVNVYVKNAPYDGININGWRVMHFYCIVENCGDDGFNSQGGGYHTYIGCVARNMIHDGFHLSNGEKGIVIGCEAYDNGGSGLETLHERILIVSSRFVGNHAHGISIYGDYAIIVANECYNCGMPGVSTGHGIIIKGNNALVANNFVADCTGGGIRIEGDEVRVIGNTVRYFNTDMEQDYAIGITADASNTLIKDNDVTNGGMDIISDEGTNTIIQNNIGYATENSGTATFSGDGTTTQFSIAHGLVKAPSKVLVTPMTADAASDFYVTADDTNIYINYKSAPPSGTDNLKFSWYAEV